MLQHMKYINTIYLTNATHCSVSDEGVSFIKDLFLTNQRDIKNNIIVNQ